MSIDLEKVAAEQAYRVAQDFLTIAARGGSEADLRREIARVLNDCCGIAGLTITPRDEFAVARGRVDSLYNRLILEYKRPGILKETNKGNRDVIQQVKDYILDVGKREKREAHRLAGVATDGRFFIFVRRIGEGWVVDDPLPVNTGSTERFLRLLYALCTGAALVPENLVQDFGPKHMRTQFAVRAIYRAFTSSKNALVHKLFEQWRQFFSEATDYKEWSEKIESKPEFRSFVKSLWTSEEITHLDAASVFFVLHTYYALLIKLIATLAAARFAGGKVAALSTVATKEGDELRQAFVNLERGGLFREFGIRNFLEGDFFGWYLAAWNHDIEDAVSSLTKRLAEYDPGTLELAPENARDLLKKLYHYLLPREIRHDLGEYYTPDWLAERLCIQTLSSDLGDPRKRVLDPACGSGTFLVILIKFIKDRAVEKNWDPVQTLELVLQNVVGFDLNPLAVTAARTNYLLALGELLKARKGDIDIPVYQADSILTPSQGSGLFDGDVYPLKTSVGVFRVPAMFATRERMDALANTLDEAVDKKLSTDAFIEQLRAPAKLEIEEVEAAGEDLKTFYTRLRELHDQGLNGVWARIVKNAFASLFIEPCHYIVGNPPWVNWEHLPEDYRSDSIPLWQHYGLFPHGGMDTILGKGKKDISMLMTYVASDKYLRTGGKLGFVLSQSLFKTSGAGQGFRRFLLADKTPFGPLAVEDMVELKPFEGATNRTAVAVFAKGHAVRYPVSYQYWVKKKTGRSGSIGFDTPYEEVTNELITFRAWHAEPVAVEDKTSAWITAKPKALKAIRKILAPSEYTAHEGSNTGGANSVFWVEVIGARPGGFLMVSNITEGAKKKVSSTQAAIESGLVHPLLRGRDVQRWHAVPSAHIIMTQDAKKRRGIPLEIMQSKYHRTLAYLEKFETTLRARAAFKRYFREHDPYWSMFNVGKYTFSEWKVVWREQAVGLVAAVVGTIDALPVIPDHKLMMVDVSSRSEAYYLCAVLNSAAARLVAIAYSIEISMSPHILRNIRIPRFSETNPIHRKLSELSESAHKASKSGDPVKVVTCEKDINTAIAMLWNLSEDEMHEIHSSLIDRDKLAYEWDSAREATRKSKVSLTDELLEEREKKNR